MVIVKCYFICVKAQTAIINILGQLVNQPGQALWGALLPSELLDGPINVFVELTQNMKKSE